MTTMLRSAVRNRFGNIDVEISSDGQQWFPYTTSPDDSSPLGQKILRELERLIAENKLSVGEYVPPKMDPEDALAAQRAAMTLTMPQLLIGLEARDWITEAEGDAWAAATALPAAALAVVSGLPAEAQYAARVRLLRMSQAERNSDLVAALAAAQGVTDEDLDAFFIEFATA